MVPFFEVAIKYQLVYAAFISILFDQFAEFLHSKLTVLNNTGFGVE